MNIHRKQKELAFIALVTILWLTRQLQITRNLFYNDPRDDMGARDRPQQSEQRLPMVLGQTMMDNRDAINPTLLLKTTRGGEDEINPTLLSQNMPKLFFVSNKTKFQIPTNIDWIMKYPGCRTKQPHKVDYMRGADQITARSEQGSCTGTLAVFSWLMERANESKSCLMVAYGDLIHAHREKDFVHKKTGKFIDDDIDAFVSLDTFARIALLEAELFIKFGWSIRIHQFDDKFATMAQIFASCGHTITLKQSKATSKQPTIEIYPIVTFKTSEPMIEAFPNSKVPNPERKEYSIVRDLWQGTLFHESMIFPSSNLTLASAGLTQPLNLQIPAQSSKVLKCLYGNWKVPSKVRAGTKNCL